LTEQELRDGCCNNSIDVADGETDGNKGWFLRWRSRDTKVDDTEISFLEADQLDGLTIGKVVSAVVHGRYVKHVSRIVGYFSRVDNWNPSKRGELKDRQAGNYRVGAIHAEPERPVEGRACEAV